MAKEATFGTVRLFARELWKRRRAHHNPCHIRMDWNLSCAAEGKRYLDVAGGIAVNCLGPECVRVEHSGLQRGGHVSCLPPRHAAGHSNPAVVETIREQAGKLLHVSNLYYTSSQV